MKKNFFKKLSFVLASAMVISAIAPAAGAFAATASPALNSAKQYLYLSEKDGKTEFDFNIKKDTKKDGWKYSWTTADAAVASVDKTNGFTTAVGVGTTKVTVTIKDSKGKAVGKPLSADVIVKDNIATVDITNAPAAALVVGDKVDLGRSFTTNSGSTKVTSSKTYWTVDKTTATVDAKGVFTATEAGEYKVTASVFQSKEKHDLYVSDSTKYAAYLLASDVVTITVAPSIKVVQNDLKKITLTSDSVIDVKNVSLYTLVGTTEVAVTTAKPITLSTDKKSATIEFYVDLTAGATYRVKYTGAKSVDFTAATAKVEDVAKVVLKTTEAEVGKAIALEVQLFNAAGVEITNKDLVNRVTYSTTAIKGVYLDTSLKTIMFFTKGETAQVEATFHTYKYESGKEVGNVIGSGTVIGVDTPSTVVGTVKAWTIVDRTNNSPSFSDVKQVLTVGEEKKIAVELNTTTGTKTGSLKTTDANHKITFTSSDNTILFVDNANQYLYPVKAGVVTLVVKQDDKTVDIITVTVGEARKATSIVLGKTDLTISNSSDVLETAKVSVKVKDQYGADVTITNSDIKVNRLAGSPDYALANAVGTDVVFTGAVSSTVKATKGTYYYEVKAKDLTAYITAVVIEPSNATPTYKLDLSATEVDNKSVKDAARPTITIDVFGYAGGAKTAHPAVSGAGYTVVVKDAAGEETTLANTTYDLTTVTGNAITAKKAGTYTVTLKNASNVAIDVQYFTVKNTQAKPSYELKSSVYTKATLDEIAKECFKVSFNGTDVTSSITMGDVIGTVGTNIYVKNVKYIETIEGTSYTIEHTVDINQLVVK